MADGFAVSVDDVAVKATLAHLGASALTYTKPASKISADSLQQEMRSRVARATGQTAEHIDVTEVEDGYVVHTSDVDPLTGSYHRALHVGLWLEKGTSLGARHSHASAARPWFFTSAQLELSAHERRIVDALEQAVAAEGLGD